MATISDLKINGVTMPTPAAEGVTITNNKVWSADTGRVASGKMTGTLVAIKAKITIKWPPLTMSEVSTIEAAVGNASSPWNTVQYTDMTGNTVTKTMYFGDPSYTQYSWINGMQYITDVSVDGIER